MVSDLQITLYNLQTFYEAPEGLKMYFQFQINGFTAQDLSKAI